MYIVFMMFAIESVDNDDILKKVYIYIKLTSCNNRRLIRTMWFMLNTTLLGRQRLRRLKRLVYINDELFLLTLITHFRV